MNSISREFKGEQDKKITKTENHTLEFLYYFV